MRTRVSKFCDLDVSKYDRIVKFKSSYRYKNFNSKSFTYHMLTLFTHDFFLRTCYATQHFIQINRNLACERNRARQVYGNKRNLTANIVYIFFANIKKRVI